VELVQLTSGYVWPTDLAPGQMPPPPRVRNYLAWPIYVHTSENDRADMATVAKLELIEPPPEAKAEGETPFTRARGLNGMRQRMADQIDARVAFGGKVAGYSGLIPGIAEEALLALEADKPVYLCGAFGGCTRLLSQAISTGTIAPGLTAKGAEQGLAGDALKQRQELVQAYAERAQAQPDFSRLERVLGSYGMKRLCDGNGLTADENELLFESPDHQLLIALILKGLKSKRPR
jgi:hypothetical protein